MLRISTCLLLTCGFLLGQEVRKPDFQGLETSYPNDRSGLLGKTIAVFSRPPERAAERQEMLTQLCKEEEFPRWADMAAIRGVNSVGPGAWSDITVMMVV